MASRSYRAALVGSAVFGVLHLLALPVLITHDGGDYIRMGLGFPHTLFDGWDYARTPIYPLALRLGFWVLGRGALGAMLPNVLFALVGIWALGTALRRSSEGLAIGGVVLLTLYPTMIVYQHAVLTEAGSFMFLALLANWATWRPVNPKRKLHALLLGTIAIFYFRATSLVLVPLAAVILALEAKSASWKQTAAVVAPQVLMLALACYLLSSSWNAIAASNGARDYAGQNVIYGVLKQVVLPPEDPRLAPVRDAYAAAIEAATIDGALDPAGIRREHHYEIFVALAAREDPGQLLRHAVTAWPGRFLAGVGRALMLNLGARSIESENDTYFHGVVTEASTGSKLYLPPGELAADVESSLHRGGRTSVIGSLVAALNVPFQLLVPLGAAMSVFGLALGCRRRLAGLVALTAIPLYWTGVNALTLMSSDRHVVPSHAFFVVNTLAVPWLLGVHKPTSLSA